MKLQPTIAHCLDFGGQETWPRLDLPPDRENGVGAAVLETLARVAFEEIAFFLPTSQLEGFAAVLKDPGAGEAERFVAASLIRNAIIAAEGVYPLCQDTGTAVVYGWRGSGFASATCDEEEALARGVRAAYAARRLRASVLRPTGFLSEANAGDNLPLHCDIRTDYSGEGAGGEGAGGEGAGGEGASGEGAGGVGAGGEGAGGEAFRLCFVAKGGGSANRTSLAMESPSLLDAGLLERRLDGLVRGLGTSGCPPYRITCVVGGLSPEESLYVLALAGLGLLDGLPAASAGGSPALRDRGWEEAMLSSAAAAGPGAQFGGSRLAIDARAIRLPRHAASLPLAFGVSCAAARRARAFIDKEGVRLEPMEKDPARFLPDGMPALDGAQRVNLDRPASELAAELGALPPGTPLLISGTVVTARDKAHARFRALVAEGKDLPACIFRHPVFYAGPTDAVPGAVSGSFGPTTAGRMDSMLPELLSRGASLVTIAKGSRSPSAARSIAEHGGVYLCAIGGAAALAAKENVVSSRIIAWPELGMEALRLVELRDLPAIIGINGEGRDFYAECGAAR